MWLLTILIVLKVGICAVEAFQNRCTSTLLANDNARVECSLSYIGEFPTNTEELILKIGSWNLVKDFASRLKSLRYLELQSMWGQPVLVEDSFGSFVTLESLKLVPIFEEIEQNAFRGLASLKTLDLSLKSHDTVPAALFSGLNNLERLHLATLPSGNKIPSSILAGLGNLKVLDLENYSEDHIPDITGLVNLQTIKLPIHHFPICTCQLVSAVNQVPTVVDVEAAQCRLFKKKYSQYTKYAASRLSCSDIPVPPYYRDVLPRLYGRENHSFKVKLIQFEEIDGTIRNYDVIVLDHDAEGFEQKFHPSEYTNDDIASGKYGLFIAGRISDRAEFGKEFVVGKSVSKRRRRDLGSPEPKALTPGTTYSVFVRGYISDTVYRSTEWYEYYEQPELRKSITTLGAKPIEPESSKFDGWKVFMIVVVIIVVITIVAAVFFYHRRGKTHVVNKSNSEEEVDIS